MLKGFRKQRVQNSVFEQQLEKAYCLSSFNLTKESFIERVAECIAGKSNELDFSEKFYLENNLDVALAVESGTFHSGIIHYIIHGRLEGRAYSRLLPLEPYGREPQLGQGLYSPARVLAGFNTSVKKSQKPNILGESDELLVFISYLQVELFYAGYSGFFKHIHELSKGQLFSKLRVVVLNGIPEPRLIDWVSPNLTVETISDFQPSELPRLIYGFDVACVHKAFEVFDEPSRLVYYCQDFEPSFQAHGSDYLSAMRALIAVENIVISTSLLRDYLVANNAISAKNVWVTSPSIKMIETEAPVPRRIFAYFRPEEFNGRNLAPDILDAFLELANSDEEYSFFLVGSVETDFSVKVGRSEFLFLSKLESFQYESLIGSSSVVVSLIYSAHPGVIAFQAAAAGIPTITNTFSNRSSEVLKRISRNIIPFDPITESLKEKILEAMNGERGKPHFVSENYSQDSPETFLEFNAKILQGNS